MLQKQSEAFHTFFPSLKQNFIAYRSSNVSSRPDYIFEIHQLWQSSFSRVYSDSCCSYLFEPKITKIGQLSIKMFSSNILNLQESTTILKSLYKKSLETYWMHNVHWQFYFRAEILWPTAQGNFPCFMLIDYL